ncbi:TniB family NTP-binding protein [Cytobacillus dafuensis]|uniref:AAA family ATPase n=1 Tax=Cytobacillus dafuensis TaxID=1742359 RepID=A0A5B8YZQ2_CYTDA|nr:TniB family NTP-binding protein [Cytobacillus dafuensis]QED46011.1 AAA family ATPase [Cytobacillus dafuensis]
MVNPYESFQLKVISIYVEHPDIKEVWNILDNRRTIRRLSLNIETNESPLNLFIMGKSRVGKTQAMKRYAAANPSYILIENEEEKDIVPVAYVLLPEPFTKKGFYLRIIKALGAPRMDESKTVEFLQDKAFGLIKKQKVEMIILDELDYILTSTHVSKKVAMELIKDLSNSTNVAVVCVGTTATDELRTINAQIMGRFPPRTLKHFSECDDSFIDLLKLIDEKLGVQDIFQFAKEGSKLPILLHRMCSGLVGWLVPIITETFQLVGVFESDFNDFSILKKIDGHVLLKARQNVIGEMTEEDINKILNK